MELLLPLLLLRSSVTTPPLPLCTSCQSLCNGTCTLPGPFNGPRGSVQNITITRMTPANLLILDDKDTGDLRGDLTFNLMETAIPIECNHVLDNTTAGDCTGQSTHSWLLNKDLVYVRWVIEFNGIYAPYRLCNILPNDTTTWACKGGKNYGQKDFTDAESCPTLTAPWTPCAARFANAVGWESSTFNHTGPKLPPPPPSPQCVAAVRAMCRPSDATTFSSCYACVAVNKTNKAAFIAAGCAKSEISSLALSLNGVTDGCPAPPLPLAPSCLAQLRASKCSLNASTAPSKDATKACIRCFRTESQRRANNSLSPANLTAAHCPVSTAHDAEDDMGFLEVLRNATCPLYREPEADSNATWQGWKPNTRMLAERLNGHWFSTTSTGRCRGAARPGDASPCTWRPVLMARVVNYTCVQKRLGVAAITAQPACFAKCEDGKEPYPLPKPSDCWSECYFNTLLGNATKGYKARTGSQIVAPFEAAFAPESEGGCPNLDLPTPPLV